jgi:hypothetical protein
MRPVETSAKTIDSAGFGVWPTPKAGAAESGRLVGENVVGGVGMRTTLKIEGATVVYARSVAVTHTLDRRKGQIQFA